MNLFSQAEVGGQKRQEHHLQGDDGGVGREGQEDLAVNHVGQLCHLFSVIMLQTKVQGKKATCNVADLKSRVLGFVI